MNALVPATLLGWPLVMLSLCVWLRPPRALIVGVVAGWLLLPVATLPVQGFIDIDKRTALSLGALVAATLLDGRRLASFRPSLVDLPVTFWCLSGLFASLSNGLGFYDGFTSSLSLCLHWLAPWFLGRVYLSNLAGFRILCKAIFVGGLLYAPLCLWEVRMSPSIHGYIYGFSVYEGITFMDELGKWGSRPSVLLSTPLELGMFMTFACLCGLTLAWMPSQGRLLRLRTSALVVGLILVTVLCKNLGATALMLVGMLALHLTRTRRSLVAIQFLACLAPLYAIVRTTDVWDGKEVVEIAAMLHEGKAASFEFRLDNEEILIEKALEKPLFGWGKWGRSRIYDESGYDISVTDGLWVIVLGMFGLWGLTTMMATLLVPVQQVSLRVERGLLRHEQLMPAVTTLVLVVLMALDSIPNDFPSPLVLLGAGGLAGIRKIRGGPTALAGARSRRDRLPLPR